MYTIPIEAQKQLILRKMSELLSLMLDKETTLDDLFHYGKEYDLLEAEYHYLENDYDNVLNTVKEA